MGHSNRKEEELLNLLKEFQIETVIDIRRFPTSKKFPHFKKDHLKGALQKANIEYIWLGEKLGGFRKGGYQGWMKTDEFASGIEELKKKASEKRTVFMCAEALYARCHRKHIVEFLEQRGWKVLHISFRSKKQESSLTATLFSDKDF